MDNTVDKLFDTIFSDNITEDGRKTLIDFFFSSMSFADKKKYIITIANDLNESQMNVLLNGLSYLLSRDQFAEAINESRKRNKK